jgi:ATP-dependent DNA helicase DinG
VASATFWEGVDLPGDMLQLVVIDKLPFPPPDDPWSKPVRDCWRAWGEGRFTITCCPRRPWPSSKGPDA